jgi:hypothetical protein
LIVSEPSGTGAALGLQGWLRSVSHTGSGACAVAPGIQPRTSFESIPGWW